MKILTVIVTYNSEKWIEKNINSILNDTSTYKVDVIVIDNGSIDNTVLIVNEKFPNINLIVSDENIGFGKANNIAFKYALENNYDYVFLVNHDGWLLSGFWKAMNEILGNHSYSEFGLITPTHFDHTETELDFGFKRYIEKCDCDQTSKKLIELDSINGAFLIISSECLKSIKGFDPIFFFYGEDIDLCHRAKKKGFKIGLVPEAQVVHDRKMREMSQERIWNHLVANHLIQIKQIEGGFYKSLFKTLFSIVYGYLFKNDPYKSLRNYTKLINFLLSNTKAIKKSYYEYN